MQIEELQWHVFWLSIAFESVLYTNLLSILEKIIYVKLLKYDFSSSSKFFTVHCQEGRMYLVGTC